MITRPMLTTRRKHAKIYAIRQRTGNMSPGRARAESALHRLKERAAAAAGYQPPMTGVSRALLRE